MSGPGGLVCLLCALAVAAQVPPGLDPASPAGKEFNRRIGEYLKIHKTARSEVHRLKPTASAEAIEHYEHRLAHRIREERKDAVQGNIFTPEITSEFRKLIDGAMQGSNAATIRQSLRSSTPVEIRGLRVDHGYPDGSPLQTTPPSLLMKLPTLPPELEYRVVGHDLVLRDVEANLVVDYIPHAIS